jgi:hypothetical protein
VYFCLASTCLAQSPVQEHLDTGKYLFVWAGDDQQKAGDFLAVLDVDPSSPRYGQAVASVAVPGPTGSPHHTELQMPAGGFLLANAFESGRTFLFDLRQPLQPRLATSFGDLDGYMHPHTYVRLPNGHVLATFQYHGSHGPKAPGGGLVEFSARGEFYKSSSAVDPGLQGQLIRPYSLLVLPKLNRIVSTNTSMHEAEGTGHVVQIWRLSDLKLLHSLILPRGPREHLDDDPGEPRVTSDGKIVLVHTFGCGLYELSGVDFARPTVRFDYAFEGTECAVPLLLGHYWVQTLFSAHALVTLDIADPGHPRDVSRLNFDAKQTPHWIAADPTGRRIVLNSGEYGEHRIFLIDFDPDSGALHLDERFRDPGSTQPGVSMDGKSWPQGFRGDAYPHGTVFSRADN